MEIGEISGTFVLNAALVVIRIGLLWGFGLWCLTRVKPDRHGWRRAFNVAAWILLLYGLGAGCAGHENGMMGLGIIQFIGAAIVGVTMSQRMTVITGPVVPIVKL